LASFYFFSPIWLLPRLAGDEPLASQVKGIRVEAAPALLECQAAPKVARAASGREMQVNLKGSPFFY